MNKFINSETLQGKHINLREVLLTDAPFILSLRCDTKKSQFLHQTQNNLTQQEDYLKRYFTLDNEWYFIAETKNGAPLGTIRIYDVQGDDFCIGSWIIKDNTLPQAVIESILLCYKYGFETLGFNKVHFDVRKGNKAVLGFHKSMGAKISGENEKYYFFTFNKEDFYAYYQRLKPLL